MESETPEEPIIYSCEFSLASCAETVIFPTEAGGASHLHIKLQIKREAKTKWRFCYFTAHQHPDYLFSRPQWSISRIFCRFQVFSAINMQIKTHFNCSCNLKTICTLSTQLFFFLFFFFLFPLSMDWVQQEILSGGGRVYDWWSCQIRVPIDTADVTLGRLRCRCGGLKSSLAQMESSHRHSVTGMLN